MHVDIDSKELFKGHPRVDQSLCCDADSLLKSLLLENKLALQLHQEAWLDLCLQVKSELPLSEAVNTSLDGFVNPYGFWQQLSDFVPKDAILVPCSSSHLPIRQLSFHRMG